MRQKKTYYVIPYISMLGFVITGIIPYPYGIHWDNSHIYYNLGTPNNWMGWFYPSLWKTVINITHLEYGIGLLHNVVYWISMPLIYTSFIAPPPCPLNKQYYYGFITFSFCPSIIIFLTNITNNVLLLSFLALAVGCYTASRKHNKSKILLTLSVILLLLSTLIRRDAAILSFPLLAYIVFATFRSKLCALLVGIICIALIAGINHLATRNIKDYHDTIQSIELITIYDITGMSYYKKELLIPDEILKEEYRGSNRYQIMDRILSSSNIHSDAITFSGTGLNSMLLSGTSWKSGLTLKKALPIYISNILYYIWFRLKTIKAYTANMNSLSESSFYQDILERENIPLPSFNIIQSLRQILSKVLELAFLFFFQEWFYFLLTIVSLYLLHSQSFYQIYPPEDRSFCSILIIIGFIGSILSMIAAVSVQLRYLMPANLLIWIAFIYSIQRFFRCYKICFSKKF